METKEFICINCPLGCPLTVTLDGDEVIGVEGNSCPKGVAYAGEEAVAPKRMVTALVSVRERRMPVSVKTERAIPKQLIGPALESLSGISLAPPVHLGDVILHNVVDTGIDVIATKYVL